METNLENLVKAVKSSAHKLKISRYEIAKRAGVKTTTVSRFLGGSAGGTRLDTVLAILKACELKFTVPVKSD